jgi:hypothetical protein
LGSNANEGAGFVSYTPDGPGADALFRLTESIIACPVSSEIRWVPWFEMVDLSDVYNYSNRIQIGLPTYRYQYAGNFSNISPLDWMGAFHSCKNSKIKTISVEIYSDKVLAELPLIFGTHNEFRTSSTAFEFNVSHTMEGKIHISSPYFHLLIVY